MRVFQIVVVLLVLLGLNYYVFYRLWRMMPAILWGRVLLVASAVVVILSPFVAIFLGDHLPLALASLLHTVGTAWFIILLYLMLIFLLLDGVRLSRLIPVEKIMYESWLGFGAVLLLLVGLTTFGYLRYLDKERVALTVPIEKNMPQPLKIVAVSDLHLGYGIGNDELEQWVALINAEQPDIVLIAGDVIDHSVRTLYQQGLSASLKKLKSRYGVYAVLGNHEYIGNVQESIEFFRRSGITLLRDDSVLIDQRVSLVGRDDRMNKRRKSLELLTAPLDHAKPILLLDHQPYELDQAPKNGVDFQFSGHTHQGQIWPVSLLVDRLYEQAYGYLRKENSHIYVSSGLGIWGGKFRIGTRSEYVVITLRQR